MKGGGEEAVQATSFCEIAAAKVATTGLSGGQLGSRAHDKCFQGVSGLQHRLIVHMHIRTGAHRIVVALHTPVKLLGPRWHRTWECVPCGPP